MVIRRRPHETCETVISDSRSRNSKISAIISTGSTLVRVFMIFRVVIGRSGRCENGLGIREIEGNPSYES